MFAHDRPLAPVKLSALSLFPAKMTAKPNARFMALSEQLADGIPAQGNFETDSRVRTVAPCPSDGARLAGKVAIVTGANSPSGMGRASAHQFAVNGARAIYICDFNDRHLARHERDQNHSYPETAVKRRPVTSSPSFGP